MIANVSAHRRANAFAQALEEQPEQGTAAEQPEGSAPAPAASEPSEQDRHLALASGLGALPKPELDPEVKVVQRAQLVAAFEAMLQEGTAGGLSVGVAASAFGGVSVASSDALPGDSLYGLKRGIEDVTLGLADGSDERGRVYLDHASTRLSEARRLMERGRSGPLDHESLGEIRRALSGMRHDASEGHRLLSEAYERDPNSLGPIQALSAFSSSHREAWGELRERLPVQLGDVSEQVSSVFDAIDEDVAPLQSLLPEPPATTGGDGKRRGASESAPSGSSGTDRSTRPGDSGGRHSEEGRTGSGSRSAGSGSDSDGLLGGSTGGLLDPPKDKDGEASASPSAEGNTPVPEPDVTLPPLLPGLLPGLGIDSEDAD